MELSLKSARFIKISQDFPLSSLMEQSPGLMGWEAFKDGMLSPFVCLSCFAPTYISDFTDFSHNLIYLCK